MVVVLGFSEQQFIDWITAGPRAELPTGPGDDAAVLHDGTVIALDTVVEGVHFEPGTALDRVARKALGACLSDLCAMGAVAESVFVSAQLPPGCEGEALASGLVSWAARFAVTIAGGDTVATRPGALALAVTATGRCPAGRAPWLRSGAQVGDRLVLTGPLGGSRSGRHLDVRPRADVVSWIHRHDVQVHGAIDLSDGLGRDLPRMTTASAVGANVRAADVPRHDDIARASAHDGPGPDNGPDNNPAPGQALGSGVAFEADTGLAAALGDGEDFELLLALPTDAPLPPGAHDIGTLVDGHELRLELGGQSLPWPGGGHEHAF
jgi:thiamine-monophosphate kinase